MIEMDYISEKSSHRRLSDCSSACLPAYKSGALTPTTSVSEASLPGYEEANKALEHYPSSQSFFKTTKSLQIEANGQPLIAFPLCSGLTSTYIFEVDAAGDSSSELAYESIRTKKRSGNSILVRAGHEPEAPVCSTSYRFGPGRPPRLCMHGLREAEEEYELVSKGYMTRGQRIRTHLGTFEWRYASRKERKAENADSLLVMDLVTTVSTDGEEREQRRKVAQLVRSDEYRTPGTRGSTAGNGGRLMMDLRDWVDSKGEVEQMEVLAVATCLVMLKKEVDRRKTQQAIVVMSAAGGGP